MARGRKKDPRTLEEKIAAVDAELTECENRVKELRKKKKELEKEAAQKDKETLYEAMLKSGKTVDEVLGILGVEKTAADENQSE
ncbi:MAG TPA: flagellar export protein FliJ [Candidatus Limivivens intestinipullorum]|uniref:Flagellar export protein FliJ n=1 Tax=Candidatus Limivivens intestinipullorum TaxID=2840858 RepID=A0A9D1EW10_9FIRM|nr:flagellar export protein FliJ [Candidatus Limivivens intestinipullorum]